MSTPISATSTRATVSLTPGIVVSRSAASRKGRSTSSACCSSFCTAARNASICPRCSSSRKRWCAVTRPCTAATMSARPLHADVGAISQPLGIGLPAMSAARIARPLTPRCGDHACQLHVRVFERLLQALRVPRDLADQLLAGSRQVAQFLDRGRRHEAAPNQPVRQQVGDPGRVLPVALAARNVPDVLRVGEHQRQRRFVFEDVPHWLPVHAGRLHRHVRAAGLGQPGRQCEQTRRRGRKLPVLGRDLPTRRDARARVHAPRVDIQPGAPGMQDFHAESSNMGCYIYIKTGSWLIRETDLWLAKPLHDLLFITTLYAATCSTS